MFKEGLLTRTLVELADNLVDDFDVIDVLTTLSDRCVDILDVDAAGVMLVDGDGDLQVVASSSEAMRILELFELQASQGPCVDCYQTGQPIVNEKLSADERWPTFTPQAIRAGYHSVHALPMRSRGRTFGALNLFRIDTGTLRQRDVVAAQALADVATIAIVQNHTALGPPALSGQLSEVLYSRIIIEQAKGVISEATGLDMERAFRQLRHYARTHNIRLVELSVHIADGTIDPRALDPSGDIDPGRSATTVSAGRTSSATVTVCVVEGNAHLREQLQEFLVDGGVNVLAAVGSVHAGEEAITANRPDVAVIDNRLPDGTGTDLIRALTRSTPQVTLLLYTTAVTDHETSEALEAGATAVIPKSIQAADLIKAILDVKSPSPRS